MKELSMIWRGITAHKDENSVVVWDRDKRQFHCSVCGKGFAPRGESPNGTLVMFQNVCPNGCNVENPDQHMAIERRLLSRL